MDRVLSRIHNLELLALRQTTPSRTSVHQQLSSRYQSPVVQNQHYLQPPQTTQNHTTKHSAYLDDKHINQSQATHDISKVTSTNEINSDNAARNAGNFEKKSSNLNTSSLIARLEMMKTDFLMMEQKYF